LDALQGYEPASYDQRAPAQPDSDALLGDSASSPSGSTLSDLVRGISEIRRPLAIARAG